MEEHIYYNNLFDCYRDLLTENEQTCFSSYYEDDLSLSEIATINKVSRAAIHKTVKNVIEKLENYEHILHLEERKIILEDCLRSNDINEIKEKIEKLLEM